VRHGEQVGDIRRVAWGGYVFGGQQVEIWFAGGTHIAVVIRAREGFIRPEKKYLADADLQP